MIRADDDAQAPGVVWAEFAGPSAFRTGDERTPAGTAPRVAHLGERTIAWADARSAAEATARSVLADRAPSHHLETASDLRLVTQMGDSFRAAHPHARVLVDAGRHLVVDAADVALGQDPDGTCWRVEPMPADPVVVALPGPAARAVDPFVSALLATLSQSAFMADVVHLASLPTRHSLSPGFRQAADWAQSRLDALGYLTARPAVSLTGGPTENLVAELTSPEAGNRRVVLVTAHLDSINLAGASTAAPGADDNASGSAGLLAIGAALAHTRWTHDLRLVLFGGEEQGLHGSKQYVATLPANERSRILAVVNMDMISARNATPAPSVLLEGATVSQSVIGALASAAATYTTLTIRTSLSPFASDHVPFIIAGIPAVLTIEGADSANANIHSDRDTVTTLDPALALEILRMNTAALADLLVPKASHPRPAGPVVSWEPGRIDIFLTGAAG